MQWLNDFFGSISGAFSWLGDTMDTLNNVVIEYSGAWWVLLAVFLFCAIDGFFPPVPSESVVVGLGAIAVSSGNPNILLLILAAAGGAWVGDNTAYLIGRAIGTDRFKWMRRERVQKSFTWAGEELRKRAVSLILVARFIPGGRVAVNFTAGATSFSHRAFMLLTVLSGVCWAGYSVAIGAFAGAWMHDNPLLGALIAIILAIILGVALDRIIMRIHNRRAARHDAYLASRAREAQKNDGDASNSVLRTDARADSDALDETRAGAKSAHVE